MTTEPKPIVVISLPDSLGRDGRKTDWSDCRFIQKYNEKEKPDYHWFVIPNYDLKTVEFKVFYSKDFTEIQYAELKKIIEDAIEKQKQ